jgi:glucosamine--fructose-6-phosphate aminotransferase (isomerizing)
MHSNTRGAHTRAEILSQPQVWQASLNRLAGETAALPDLNAYDQVVFTGCGSTHYLSIWAARLYQQETGRPCIAAPGSELMLTPHTWIVPNRQTLLVAVSRSAETTETIRAVEVFRRLGLGDVLTVTCYPDRELARIADWVLAVPDSQEESVAQTRSFSSMVVSLIWFLTRDADGSRLAAAAQGVIDQYQSLAEQLGTQADLQRFFFLGNGPRYGLASEAMLKMKEMSLSYSEAYHFMEFRHGPMSMADRSALVIGLIGLEHQRQEMKVLEDMRGLGATTLGIVTTPTEPRGMDHIVQINAGDLPAVWQGPLYLPFLQLVGFYRSLANGLNPDRPNNLEAVVVLDE